MVPASPRTLLYIVLCALALVAIVTMAAPAAAQEAPPADPDNDTIGWEDGRWHNESIPLNQSDGLNETEREAFLARSLARIEAVKDTEIDLDTKITYQLESEYEFCGGTSDPDEKLLENIRWEAGFAVGEETDVQEVDPCEPPVAYFGGEEYGGVVVVVEDPETYRLDGRVLIHELAHAVQPEAKSPFDRTTVDGSQARYAVIEGDANWVTANYVRRCGETWECERYPEFVETNVSGAEYAIRVESLFGYTSGPAYVADLVEREGYDAVAAKFPAPPSTTEQVIHYTDERRICTDVQAQPRGSWARVGDDRLGEVGVFTTFWYGSYAYDAGVMDPNGIYETPASRHVMHNNSIAALEGPYKRFNYTHSTSAGWAGDRLVAYSNGSHTGYVWKTKWDTEKDASEFHEAYRKILSAHDARSGGNGTWVITDGPFADTFRVVRDGNEVIIVNGPTVSATATIHPASTPQTVAETPTKSSEGTTDAATDTPTTDESCVRTDENTPDEETPTAQSGFGIIVALLALILTGWIRRR